MSVMRWGARLAPVLIIAVVGYVVYAVIVSLVYNYLFYPSGRYSDTPAAGIVILVFFCILLLMMSVSYFQCVYHGIFDAGFVGQVSQDPETGKPVAGEWQKKPGEYYPRWVTPPPELEEFYELDFFNATEEGKPKWCDKCKMWKPERAHHLSSVGFCVQRLDHYCPWVGGIVARNNFKFFIQFCVYAALFSVYALIVSAVYVREAQENYTQTVNEGLTIALGVLFFCLAGGTGTSAILCASNNLTTLENVNMKTAVWQLMIQTKAKAGTKSHAGKAEAIEAPEPLKNSFRLTKTTAGSNPYDMGVVKNFKQVLGRSWYDWLLPIRSSPFCEPHWPQGDERAQLSLVVEFLRQEMQQDQVDPKIRKDYERARLRGKRFPHILAAAGAPLRTCKVAAKTGAKP